MSPREAAFFALLKSLQGKAFIQDELGRWHKECKPSSLDFAFAYQIASGAARMALALDFIATNLTSKKKLSLKLQEKALLRTALFQFCCMDRVPLYAIVNETVNIAKKHFNPFFAKFLNALLRGLNNGLPDLPKGNSLYDMSIRYSYPEPFIKEIIGDYGLEKAQEILISGNSAPKTFLRIRMNKAGSIPLTLLPDIPVSMGLLEDMSFLEEASKSQDYYIQNVTPAILMAQLAGHGESNPKRILDLCASPGGKLFMAHEIFPEAALFANDVSMEKIGALSENLEKYKVPCGLTCGLTCGLGENYSSNEKFDLIILDVPCSNSGVFNKRPEARWRINSIALEGLEKIQLRLFEHARTLLNPGGVIWYLTCSLLKRENEFLTEKAAKAFGLHVEWQQTILPNCEGWDGGYACKLRSILDN